MGWQDFHLHEFEIGGQRYGVSDTDERGPYGYADLIEILARPRHKEHRQMREWAGKNFDPEKFSAKAANLLLKQTLPKSANLKTEQNR